MIAGGCLCGAVRYRTDAEPIVTRLCWCRVCQYIAAGNAAVGVCFPTAGLTVAGETRDFVSIADSGNRMHRRFCPSCGTHLFSEAESRPHLIFVRAGTLDEERPIMGVHRRRSAAIRRPGAGADAGSGLVDGNRTPAHILRAAMNFIFGWFETSTGMSNSRLMAWVIVWLCSGT
jgi:hypothetical protein